MLIVAVNPIRQARLELAWSIFFSAVSAFVRKRTLVGCHSPLHRTDGNFNDFDLLLALTVAIHLTVEVPTIRGCGVELTLLGWSRLDAAHTLPAVRAFSVMHSESPELVVSSHFATSDMRELRILR